MDDGLEKHLEFLRLHGAGSANHVRGSLLRHLAGTQKLLASWGARRSVCDAGLFHSVYGTEAYQTVTVPRELRNQVQQLIGPEAEELVWLFCAMDREAFATGVIGMKHPRLKNRENGVWIETTHEQASDLANLLIANALEVVLRPGFWNAAKARDAAYVDLFPLRDLALPGGREAIDSLVVKVMQPAGNRLWHIVRQMFRRH